MRWQMMAAWAGLAGILTGCGAGNQTTLARPVAELTPPATYPAVLTVPYSNLNAGLRGQSRHIRFAPDGLSVLVQWTNVPASGSWLTWSGRPGRFADEPLVGMQRGALDTRGNPVWIQDSRGGAMVAFGHRPIRVPATMGPTVSLAVSPDGRTAFLAAEGRGGRVLLGRVGIQGGTQLATLPAAASGPVTGMAAGLGGWVWVAESDPARLVGWRVGQAPTIVSLTGRPLRLVAKGSGALVLTASTDAVAGTADRLTMVDGSRGVVRTWGLTPAVPVVPGSPPSLPWVGGATNLLWTGSTRVLLAFWNPALNQVAVEEADLATGQVHSLPGLVFSADLPAGQSPDFPLATGPTGLIAVGSGDGVAFYLPDGKAFQFLQQLMK